MREKCLIAAKHLQCRFADTRTMMRAGRAVILAQFDLWGILNQIVRPWLGFPLACSPGPAFHLA
jgi:hypothetical protein